METFMEELSLSVNQALFLGLSKEIPTRTY